MLRAMTWWQDFFDDDAQWLFGPTLTPERTEAEVAGAVRLLRLREGTRVADLGCGAGRHTVALARRGMRVTGFEWSPQALAIARRRALDVGEVVPFVRCELARLPVKPARFDAAMSLFSSLGYEDDDAMVAVLSEARRALVPGGRLLVEVDGRDAAVRRFASAREWTEIDGRPVRIARRLDLAAGEERAEFHYDRGHGPRTKPFRRRLYTPSDLARLLVRSGFAAPQFFGDYEGATLGLDSPHLLALARTA